MECMVMIWCNTNIFIAVGICDHGFEPSEMKVCLMSDRMFQFSSLKAV